MNDGGTTPRLRIALLLVVCAAVACRARETALPAASPIVAATTAPGTSPDEQRLVGRWLRADSDYTIEIASVAPDGAVEARYRNPNPIHVARAEARREGSALRFLLELRDRGYPGSYYTLTYDPGSDSLTGQYHHLGLNQVFEVAFSRLGSGTGPATP
jgi:hypothetical protein